MLLDVLFPRRCVGCRKRGIPLCGSCLATVSHPHESPHEWIVSVFSYKDPCIKKAIRRFKYSREKIYAEVFAPYLETALTEHLAEVRFLVTYPVILVPVPITAKRKKGRGYNQSLLLAKALVRRSPLFEVRELLEKVRETIPQSKIRDRYRRGRNLEGVFRCKESVPKEATIVLVDDVTTTGATLVSARQALTARYICAITIAH